MVVAAHDRGQIPGAVQQLEGSADLAVGEAVQREGSLLKFLRIIFRSFFLVSNGLK